MRNSVRLLIIFIVSVIILSPVVAQEQARQNKAPVFTNRDLTKYRVRPAEDAEPSPPSGKTAEAVSRSRQPVNTKTLIRNNDRAVVGVIAYNRKGVPLVHGSGFMVTRDGAVVTSHHLVRNAESIKVIAGNRVHDVAGLLHEDRENDIAILRVAGRAFKAVTLGDSDRAGIAQKVYVMSSPTGGRKEVSEGVIRDILKLGYRKRVLQLTAPFSVGSSGGPVFNSYGEVIGIAAYKIKGVQDLHFAVPVNLIRHKISGGRITETPYPLPGKNRNSAGYWLTLAEGMLDAGKYANAVVAYQKALEIQKDMPVAYNGLGSAYLQLRKFTDATGAFQEALRLQPRSAWTRSNLGLAYSERGRYEEAVVELKEALKIMPDLATAHFNLGITYRRMKRHTEAIGSLGEAVRIAPRYANAHYELGLAYLDAQDRRSAEKEHAILTRLDSRLARKLSRWIER